MKTALKMDEKVILETKLHWFILVLPALITLVLSAAGFVIGSYGMLVAPLAVGYFIYKIFGYGDVEIQTAAEIGSTTYSTVQNS